MKNIFILFFFLLGASALSAQGNIGVNDSNPDPLAILDMESTTQGVLVPRMTEAERTAIPAGADQKGLLVFQTDNNSGFWFYNGAAWEKIGETGGRIVDFAFVSGNGLNPTTTLAYIGPTAVVTVTNSSQKIWVVANKALGSTTGATNLGLYIGYSASGVATPIAVGGGSLGLQVSANNRTLFGLSAVIQGLAPGDYQVGLAGSSSTAAQWNSNEYGYVTAIVFE